MSSTPRAFAQRVLAAFTEAGRATDSQVIAAGGPSTSSMTLLRAVAKGEREMPEPREPTWSKIDKAARWQPGSSRRVWTGGDPVSEADAFVASPGETVSPGATNDEVLQEIRAMRAEQQRMSERLARLEEQRP